jgi:Zn-finger nucleic acid-binding protein
MKCIYCSAPLPKQGLNCNYCNRLNPLNANLFETRETKMSKHLCPCCQIALKRLETSTVNLEYCNRCDGVLISEEEFENLIRYQVNPATTFNPYYLRFIQDYPRDNRKKSQFHPCPICSEMMSVINYKKNSGILLDICENHGIWLDGGELRQIIDWYAVGGDKKVYYK